MKKIKVLSLILALMVMFAAMGQTVSAVTMKTEKIEISQSQSAPTPPLRSAGAAVATAVAKRLLGRAVQEVSAFAIANDIPILGGIAKLMLTPAQRADAKERAQVEEILTKVTAMEQSIANMQTQLSIISIQIANLSSEIAELQAAVNQMQWQVAALEQKLAQQEAALSYQSALQSLQDISGKYTSAWNAYVRMNQSVDALVALNEEKSNTTDAARLAELEVEIAAQDIHTETAVNAFINILSEGGGFTFAADLGNLQDRIWNPTLPEASYLGAYEAYLRLQYPFEHQITDELISAMQSCTDMMYRIFLMYVEYYSYMQAKYPTNAQYSAYTPEFFELIQQDMLTYLYNMAEESGVNSYMVEEPLSAEEIAELTAEDPSFVPPESIDTTITIANKTYNCYKVRSNSDNKYYIVLKDFVTHGDLVKTTSLTYFSDSATYMERPAFILDHQYTDDGMYKMISSDSLPEFITDAFVGVVSHLRVEGGLTDLPQDTERILLGNKEYAGFYNSKALWNINSLDASAMGLGGVVKTLSSSSMNRSIAIYRAVETNEKYTSDSFNVTDKVQLEGKEISVGDGQTLDMSAVTVNINNVTINVIGNATIISNGNIELTNSEIRISAGSEVTIRNLKITARANNTAAIKVLSTGTKINFVGNNLISGTSNGNTDTTEVYRSYVPGMTVWASHGMYIAKSANLHIDGSSRFIGKDGGAGICVENQVFIKGAGSNASLYAEGSYKVDDSGGYSPESIGAGIGGAFSGSVQFIRNTNPETGNVISVDKKYFSGRCDKFIGANAKIYIDSCKVEAVGVEGSSFKSFDIGGVSAGNKTFDVNGGEITGSEIIARRHSISSKIDSKNNDNYFNPEVYNISIYTHGTNGITKTGVKIKLHGSEKSSDWVTLDGCGVKEGTWNGSIVIPSVGSIEYIELKTVNENNAWFPGEIKISAVYGGESITLYGGRWIKTAQTVRPTDVVYKVTVKTSGSTNAGTNSDVELKLVDTNGKATDNYELHDIHHKTDAFEKNDTATFWLYAPDGFGECIGAYLFSDHSGAAAGWRVASISVERVSGPSISGVTDSFTVDANYWFEESQTVNFGKYSGGTGAFFVEIKTSDVNKAGTDSNISLEIVGELGSTGKIDIGAAAGSDNNFEKGDLDTMYLGFEVGGIGEITDIIVTKDDKYAGPDWHLSYITVKEITSDASTARKWQFDYNGWIKNNTYTLSNPVEKFDLKSSVRIDREILQSLTANPDGSFTFNANGDVTVPESVFDYIAERSAVVNVVMNDGDKILYEVQFNGAEFDHSCAVDLAKGYSFADGRGIFSFLKEAALPRGTIVRIHAQNLGFTGDGITLLVQNENGEWEKYTDFENEAGIIEFCIDNLDNVMLAAADNAWISTPVFDGWELGAEPIAPSADSVFGEYYVRYVGTATDGTVWDSLEAPTKAGAYTAVFTVDATEDYSGLICEVEFTITDNSAALTAPVETPNEKKGVAWIWITLGAAALITCVYALYKMEMEKKARIAAGGARTTDESKTDGESGEEEADGSEE